MTLATCRALVGPQMAIRAVHTEPTGRGAIKVGYILGCCTLLVIAHFDLKIHCMLDLSRAGATRYSAGVWFKLPSCVLPSLLHIVCMP